MTAAILPEPQMQQTTDCNNSQKLPCFVFLRDMVAKQAARPEITSEFPLQLFPLFAPNACHPLLACLFAYLLACLLVSLLACLIACHPSLCLFACQPAPCSRFRWMKHRVICESCSDRLKTMIPVLDALCNFLNTN